MDINRFDILKKKYEQITLAEHEKNKVRPDYLASLDLLKKRYERILPETPKPNPDTIPTIFGRTYNENFLSDYLAYVLDPKRNGIGGKPLQTLLNLVIQKGEIPSCDNASITREYSLENGRIDLLIEIDDVLIFGIENKIFARESLGQTKYYAEKIPRLFNQRECCFAFLTPSGTKASSPKFVAVSYIRILEEFRKIKYDWSVNVKKSVFWEDFLTHLEAYITMNTKSKVEISEKTKLYIENYDMLDDLQKSFYSDWPKIINFLEAKILSSIGEGTNQTWLTKFNANGKNFWHKIYKPHWDRKISFAHFEFWIRYDQFLKKQFSFMVDVDSQQLIDLFHKVYPDIKHEYDARGITYRPSQRNIAIAWKEYTYDFSPETFGEAFVNAFKEFQFLTPYIDDIVHQLDNK
jgi:hypothetical protein